MNRAPGLLREGAYVDRSAARGGAVRRGHLGAAARRGQACVRAPLHRVRPPTPLPEQGLQLLEDLLSRDRLHLPGTQLLHALVNLRRPGSLVSR